MQLRRLLHSDLNSYYANRLRALQDSPSAFLTTFEEERARGSALFETTLAHTGGEKAIFGAIAKEGIVGTIGILRQERSKTSHKALIWGMYVDGTHRGNGIGGKLLDMAIQFAIKEMTATAVYLSVESNNQIAKRLYESRGFQCWGVEPFAMQNGLSYSDEDHMVLKL
jgi:ribosomal protein S18 acetylase RimI-like enzyme